MRHRKFWGATAVVGALAIFGAVIVPSTANAAAATPAPTAATPTPAPSTSAPASKASPHALSAQAAQSRVSGTLATWIVLTDGDDGPQVTLSNGQLLSTGGTVTGFVSHITSNSGGDTEGTLAYTDSGANPLSVPAVYQIDLAGLPTGYWIRADASVWGSDTSAHCFVSLGDPMQDGSSFPDPAPFTCRAEISGSFPHTQARFQVGLNAQAVVQGNVVTTGSASLVSGVWDATAPGPLAVAPDSDATFSSSSVVDNTAAPGDPLANAAFAYRIDDHGQPTDYWVSGYAQTWNFAQNGGPSSSCQVFQGNPADGGHPAGSDAAY